VTFPDNHDMSRIFTQLNEDYDLWKMAMVFTVTTRGIPQIYYGSEILMTNPGTTDHGIIRSDFPGGWENDQINARTGAGLTNQQKEAQAFTKKLLNWRKEKSVIHNGKLLHFVPQDGTYVYFRYNDEEKVMIVLNKNSESTNLELGRFTEVLAGHQFGEDILTGSRVALNKNINLAPKSVMIIELD
ncbi:MAG: cyclomaltodextrinase C-terminal domain-containing protein, partial [Bacteroidota bacterium]